ncbi:MAG: hypothetical protein KUL83_10145 [Lentimicrobium sp.]|nr:hypothetical protein [Lentimicrobium sp.]
MKKLILPILLIFSVFSGSNIDAQICYTCPGQNNNVSGSAASAFGNNNTVGGSYSTSIGSGNTIPANYSFVAGSYSTAQSMLLCNREVWLVDLKMAHTCLQLLVQLTIYQVFILLE